MKRTTLESGVARVLGDLGTPSAGERIVVALSGGADSVALADALVALGPAMGFDVVAAHLDHGIRPESASDAAFCADLCARLGIALRTATADVKERARREGGGLEQAGRLERYMFLRQVKEEAGAVAIAVAHTRDDQAETVLLRLLRGSGRAGLGAMRPRSGDLLRPLLGLSREDVLDHLHEKGLSWREDPTNADLALTRNRVRHELIPYLERHFNPAVRDALARTAAVLAEESDVLASLATDAARARGRAQGTEYVLSRTSLAGAPRAVARLSVRKAMQHTGGLKGVGLGHVDRVLALAARPDASGKRLPLPGRRAAVVHFDEVRIGPASDHAAFGDFSLPLPVPGHVRLPDGRSLVARRARARQGDGATSAVVDAPLGPLRVRTRQPGDRVRAGGREVSLKRFLMDRRVPAAERGSLPLVASGHRILWVPGQRVEAAGPRQGRLVRLELRSSTKERRA